MAGWFQVDEGFSDVFGPCGPLRRIDTSIDVGVYLIDCQSMSEVPTETITILQDCRDIFVSGEESESPTLVEEDWRFPAKTGVRGVWIVLEGRVVCVESQRASPLA